MYAYKYWNSKGLYIKQLIQKVSQNYTFKILLRVKKGDIDSQSTTYQKKIVICLSARRGGGRARQSPAQSRATPPAHHAPYVTPIHRYRVTSLLTIFPRELRLFKIFTNACAVFFFNYCDWIFRPVSRTSGVFIFLYIF